MQKVRFDTINQYTGKQEPLTGCFQSRKKAFEWYFNHAKFFKDLGLKVIRQKKNIKSISTNLLDDFNKLLSFYKLSKEDFTKPRKYAKLTERRHICFYMLWKKGHDIKHIVSVTEADKSTVANSIKKFVQNREQKKLADLLIPKLIP